MAAIGGYNFVRSALFQDNFVNSEPSSLLLSASSTHYENFPVASILLPAHLRQPVQVIYAFARSADDFADEGSDSIDTRLANLREYARELDFIEYKKSSNHALFQQLSAVIARHSLPLSLFRDLLNAFQQDVVQTRYADFAELMDYCRRSADPIGRLLLHLFQATEPENLRMSDQICSALQLINHWQDIAIDWQKNDGGRVYLPQSDLAHYGLSSSDIGEIARGECTPAWREMMAFQTARARQLMLAGAPLSHRMSGRFGAELRLIVAGGLAILDKIDAVHGDVFRHRPTLTKWDWLRIAPPAILKLRKH